MAGRTERYKGSDIRTFAETYVRTKNSFAAYKAMRPDTRMAEQSIRNMANRLLKDNRFITAISQVVGVEAAKKTISKGRLCELLTDEIEKLARDGRLAKDGAKIIELVCKMNGFFEAQKIEVKHGAIDDDLRSRALRSLQQAGMDVVDALPPRRVEDAKLLDAGDGADKVEFELKKPDAVYHDSTGRPASGEGMLDKMIAEAERVAGTIGNVQSAVLLG